MSGIYDEPELYQVACAYRDVPAEVDALLSWADIHWRGAAGQRWNAPATAGPGEAAGQGAAAGQGKAVRGTGLGEGESATAAGRGHSVLELAAGPAEHALELARRGLRSTALDINPAMCGWASGRAEREELPLDVVEADMRDFKLPGRFDLAITMLNSACHLFTLDDLLAHLGAVAAHLAPGALYIMELAHPADYLGREARTSSEWTIDAGGVRAEVRWGGPRDPIDPVTQITREHVNVTVRAADGTVRTLADVVPNRFWTATEVTAAIRLAGGFTVAATYGDFDDTTTIDAPEAWRMILVLRRD